MVLRRSAEAGGEGMKYYFSIILLAELLIYRYLCKEDPRSYYLALFGQIAGAFMCDVIMEVIK